MTARTRCAARRTMDGPRAKDSCDSGTCPPRRPAVTAWRCLVGSLLAATLTAGCTTPSEYVHNGFKVGPNYCPPDAAVAANWIDANDKRVRSDTDDLSQWWRVFNDPVLDSLINDAYRQNLTLREAGFRVLAARAQLGIANGNLFPQQQYAHGDHTRTTLSTQTADNIVAIGNGLGLPVQRNFSQWDYGFALGW